MTARKPPPLSAPKAEHKRYAQEVLDDPDYKREPPGGMRPNDEVPEKGRPEKEA